MNFSKAVFMSLAGITTASSYLPDLNSTELAGVLVGAGPVIIEVNTVTEQLTVISMRTPRYMWLNKPIPLTRVPSSPAISEAVDSTLQNRALKAGCGFAVTVESIQTISTTRPVSFKKWHGPHSHLEATATISAPLDDVPVITASAF